MASGEPHSNRAMRVLLVDDEAAIRFGVSRYLRQEGFNVDMATSAREAIEHLDGGGYDTALIDLRLSPGDNSGLAIIEHVKRGGLQVRLLVMTAYNSISTQRRLHTLGIQVVEKPITLPKIVEALLAEWRVPLEGRIHIYEPATETTFQGTLHDVSRSGAYVELEDPVDLGATLELEMEMPGGGMVAATAEVMRHGRSNEPPGIGVRFLSLAPVVHTALDRVVSFRVQQLSGSPA